MLNLKSVRAFYDTRREAEKARAVEEAAFVAQHSRLRKSIYFALLAMMAYFIISMVMNGGYTAMVFGPLSLSAFALTGLVYPSRKISISKWIVLPTIIATFALIIPVTTIVYDTIHIGHYAQEDTERLKEKLHLVERDVAILHRDHEAGELYMAHVSIPEGEARMSAGANMVANGYMAIAKLISPQQGITADLTVVGMLQHLSDGGSYVSLLSLAPVEHVKEQIAEDTTASTEVALIALKCAIDRDGKVVHVTGLPLSHMSDLLSVPAAGGVRELCEAYADINKLPPHKKLDDDLSDYMAG